MRIIKICVFAFVAISLVSCNGKSDKSAEVSDKKEVLLNADGSEIHQFNIEKSKVYWIGKKVVGQHNGTINIKEGVAYMKDGALTGGKAVIDMTTINILDLTDTGMNSKLKGHLESDDFFSVAKFKTAEFEISEVKKGTDKYIVTGNLTIKGITKSITFDVHVVKGENNYSATADFDIDRTAWDIKYGSGRFFDKLGDNMINDNFNIRFEIVTVE